MEPITAASRKQPVSDMLTGMAASDTSQMKTPENRMVSSTPAVESSVPCRTMGRVSLKEVSSPAVNRMMVIAKWPMFSASSKSSKRTPSTSSPATMPKRRNSSREGTP